MRNNVMRQAGTSESQYHLGVSQTSRDSTSSVIITAMDSMMSPRTEIVRILFGARQREKEKRGVWLETKRYEATLIHHAHAARHRRI